MTGHLLGAAGGVEAIYTIKALQTGIIQPTINLETPGEGCDLDYVPNTAREAQVHDFLVGQTQAVLDGRDTAPPSRADEYLDPQLDSDFQLSQDPGEAMSQVLAMSLSDLSKLTMEQVALLHAQLPEQDIDIASAETQRAEARIELANQVRRRSETDGQRYLSITERRHQYILRAALQKTRTGRLSDVTREEKRLLSSCYEMLARRLEPDARDERLKNMLRQALDTLGIQHN